jgi:uncharacterized glyoxalase superfamily protein PhnB
VLVGFTVKQPTRGGSARDRSVYQVLGLRDGLIVEIAGYPSRTEASSDGGEPTFGAVGTGELEICLCKDSQGGRGANGTWLAIWTDDVDAAYVRCLHEGLEVLRPPLDESWGVREMHVKHPDGHVFRISQPVHHHHHDN